MALSSCIGPRAIGLSPEAMRYRNKLLYTDTSSWTYHVFKTVNRTTTLELQLRGCIFCKHWDPSGWVPTFYERSMDVAWRVLTLPGEYLLSFEFRTWHGGLSVTNRNILSRVSSKVLGEELTSVDDGLNRCFNMSPSSRRFQLDSVALDTPSSHHLSVF